MTWELLVNCPICQAKIINKKIPRLLLKRMHKVGTVQKNKTKNERKQKCYIVPLPQSNLPHWSFPFYSYVPETTTSKTKQKNKSLSALRCWIINIYQVNEASKQANKQTLNKNLFKFLLFISSSELWTRSKEDNIFILPTS